MMLRTLNGRVRCEEFKPIPTKHILLFTDKKDWVTDILLLSSFWDELDFEDKIKLSLLIAGRRKSQEFILFMRWISKNADIDDFIIMSELDANIETQ